MAADDHDQRLGGALAVALVVFLTYEKRRRVRTLTEWALVLDVLEDMETAGGEESEGGDGPRVKRTRQDHPRLDFSQSPWSIMLRKLELKQRDSGEYITETFADIFASRTSSSWNLCSWLSTENFSHWLQGTW